MSGESPNSTRDGSGSCAPPTTAIVYATASAWRSSPHCGGSVELTVEVVAGESDMAGRVRFQQAWVPRWGLVWWLLHRIAGKGTVAELAPALSWFLLVSATSRPHLMGGCLASRNVSRSVWASS
jgi:hypothetical protein